MAEQLLNEFSQALKEIADHRNMLCGQMRDFVSYSQAQAEKKVQLPDKTKQFDSLRAKHTRAEKKKQKEVCVGGMVVVL